MTPDIAIDLMLQAIWLVITIGALLVVPGLVGGRHLVVVGRD